MSKLVILFKQPSNKATFERCFGRHLSLLEKMPGVQKIEAGNVFGSPAGNPIYHQVVEVFFENHDALDKALTSPEGVATGKDLMAFAAHEVELLFVDITRGSDAVEVLLPRNLQAYLDEHAIPAQIIFADKPTPTVPAAAKALGVEVDQIVKSVVFLVDDKPFLVYGCGTRRVDPHKLAERLNISRKKVKLANAEQVVAITGYAVGTVPPLGLKTPMPVFMDPAVKQYETVYAGGGGKNAMLKIASTDLERSSRAEIAPMLHEHKTASSEHFPADHGDQNGEQAGAKTGGDTHKDTSEA
ncbi:MAG: EthD family reductase [Anaerolineae bacterium]|nr:EthD family reductase [Anaerolineae bacterium]